MADPLTMRRGGRRYPPQPVPVDDSRAYVRLSDHHGSGALCVRILVALTPEGGLCTVIHPDAEERLRDDGMRAGLFVPLIAGKLYHITTQNGGGYWCVVEHGAVRAVSEGMAISLARRCLRASRPAPVPVATGKRRSRSAAPVNEPGIRVVADPERQVRRGIL